MTIKTKALRYRQKGDSITLYTTVLTASQILDHCKVDYVTEDNPKGYQRPVTKARLRKVSTFLSKREGILPTSILLCIREPERANFEAEGESKGAGEWGDLAIPNSVTLWLIDGQHRLFGIQRAFTKDGVKWVRDYRLPVTILEGVTHYEEMRHFHIINTQQKGVPTGVVDRHLVSMREVEGDSLLQSMGEKSYLRARATSIIDILRKTPESPWADRIYVIGQKRSAARPIGQHRMVTSLQTVVKNDFLRQLTDEVIARLLVNFWSALKALLPAAFSKPENYVIQTTPGVQALHLVFPQVVDLCRESKDFSPRKMHSILTTIRISTGFWHKQRGHPLTKEKSMPAQRALAQYLLDKLPRPVLPEL